MLQVETLGYTQYEYTCRMVSLEVHSSLAAVGEEELTKSGALFKVAQNTFNIMWRRLHDALGL